MNVYTIVANDNVCKLASMLESATSIMAKLADFTKKREYEDEDKRKSDLNDVFDSLLDIQHSLCNVLTLEMNEAITDEVQKEMEREAAYEAERKAKEGV